MKVGKPKSKRTTVRLRHKIEKASAAKQRKNRKLAKKDPQWRSCIKKDPGIPNLFPYKDRILHEIEEKRRLKAEEHDARRRKQTETIASIAKNGSEVEDDVVSDIDSDVGGDALDADQMDQDPDDPMAALLASARARAVEYDHDHDAGDNASESSFASLDSSDRPTASNLDPSTRAYSNLFPDVLSQADILLYVLDARDPPSTRSVAIERQIASYDGGSRRLILVLNKIDLVPPKTLQSWLTYLRRFHLVLPLNATRAAANAHTFDHKKYTCSATANTLLRALKTYAATQNLKRSLTVGVVGYPNVGKSSVINALVAQLGRKSQPAPVGAEAGVTTSLRTIKLDGNVKLLDSPGVIFPIEQDEDATAASSKEARDRKAAAQARLTLLNALPLKQVTDPVGAVGLFLQRLQQQPTAMEQLQSFYNLTALMTASGDPTTDFLIQVARIRGRLGRGGVPNLESAAKAVLSDYRDGRIGGWVEPPSTDADTSTEETRTIVQSWAKEFSLDGLWGPDHPDPAPSGEDEQIMQE